MIITFLIELIYNFLEGIINLLPQGVVFPTTWVAGVATMWAWLNAFSFIIPVQTIAIALTISVSIHLFVLVWHLFHWLLRKLPFLHIS